MLLTSQSIWGRHTLRFTRSRCFSTQNAQNSQNLPDANLASLLRFIQFCEFCVRNYTSFYANEVLFDDHLFSHRASLSVGNEEIDAMVAV